jgi:hypothetical protein
MNINKQELQSKLYESFLINEISANENQAVRDLRKELKLDDKWESSYELNNNNNNIIIVFKGPDKAIEFKFIPTAGKDCGYQIKINDEIVKASLETDPVKNICNFIYEDRPFRDVLGKTKEKLLARQKEAELDRDELKAKEENVDKNLDKAIPAEEPKAEEPTGEPTGEPSGEPPAEEPTREVPAEETPEEKAKRTTKVKL